MSAKLSLLNLHLRLLPSKVESFIDKTKREFKHVVVNKEDCSEEDVPLDYDIIFNHLRVDLYSFDKTIPDSLNSDSDSKKQKKVIIIFTINLLLKHKLNRFINCRRRCIIVSKNVLSVNYRQLL